MKEALTNSSQKKSVPTIEEVDDQSKRTTKAMKDQLRMTQYGDIGDILPGEEVLARLRNECFTDI